MFETLVAHTEQIIIQMRTKALLLAAAFAAAGVATSVAQVYSVNAVGYVNVNLATGFNMVANPLDAGAGNNTVGQLFSNIQGGVPASTRVLVFNPSTGGYTTAQYSASQSAWLPPSAAALEVKVGEGVFVFVPASAGAKVLTCVGEVMQGTLNNPLPLGFSIKANMVPQAGKPDTFGLQGTAGDRIFRFNKATGGYSNFTFSNSQQTWLPALPAIEVGEAFFYFKAGQTPGTWTRTFNVNNS